MKATNICPKCKSTTVARVKAYKGTSSSNMIQLSKWGTQFAFFDRYICTDCGYIEHYINPDDKSFQSWLQKQMEEDTLDSDFV